MINYTERLTGLMRDIVARVPMLSFIDMSSVLVFARLGRSDADGPLATCHCLTLPESEEGYYFWSDRQTGQITRRSEWFVTRSPAVTMRGESVKYMISFVLPRFCDQSLNRTRKEQFYPGAPPWLAKLDTVVHELYHIDPTLRGIRRFERKDGTYAANCHGDQFFEQVADMVAAYLNSRPDPAVYDFLRADFEGLTQRDGGVLATTFRSFPSFPQRYIERAAVQRACSADGDNVVIEPLKPERRQTRYTETDLRVRHFAKKEMN
jgi:hypothetical protein